MILKITFQIYNGQPITHFIDVGDKIVRTMELAADNKPVMVKSFYLHGPQLHTICLRESDEIEEMRIEI